MPLAFPSLLASFAACLLVVSSAAGAATNIMVVEGEDFRPSGAWHRGAYGENYYAGTFANTFLSRKAFLAAPEQCRPSTAFMRIEIPAPGRYAALVRYEAAYRFETRFRLRIEQNGRIALDRLYGARENTKVWAFGKRLTNEVAWDWGATENIVWEGHDAIADLQSGPALLTLVAENQPEPAARRNIDAILLSPDPGGIQRRIAGENYLPLDGLLTQEGDLYARVKNRGDASLNLTFPPGTEHSPYWVHQRTWKGKSLSCEPGQTSGWIEVGSLLDSLNDGQWQIGARSTRAICYDLEFAGNTNASRAKSIRVFRGLTNGPLLAYDADTRYSKRIRTTDELLYGLVDYLKEHRVGGAAPRQTLIYGSTFPPRPSDAKYTAAVEEFTRLMGATALWSGERRLPARDGLARDYVDVRDQSPAQIEATCQKWIAEGRAADIATVSLGDEIGLPTPGKSADAEFRRWLADRGARPGDMVPGTDSWETIHYDAVHDKKPALFYYSNLYRHHYGIQAQKRLTDILRRALPNAGIGANYSPHHGAFYLGETYKWVSVFREGGMTMPWSEDYIFQAPVGSQQMNFLSVDLFRAGLKNNPDGRIHFYVMPHWPGNHPASWRRQFYGDIAHGVKIFNLFEFRPVQFAYTENHCSSFEMYQAIRAALHELGTFEDIVQQGHMRPAAVGLWFSEAADIWRDNDAPFAAAKRTLYTAILHQGTPVDVVVEGDDLKSCQVLFLSDQHVSHAASKAIADWVASGGHLFATAGAGMLDEFNEPNDVLRLLFGIAPVRLVKSAGVIRFEKQDLPFAREMELVTKAAPEILPGRTAVSIDSFPVFGARSDVVATDGTPLLRFAGGNVAMTKRVMGRGTATYCAFLPGLSYFKPALPLRPVDRSSRLDSLSHWIPTNFDRNIRVLLGGAMDSVPRVVKASNPLVETSVIESIKGAVLIVNNWSGAPIRNLKLDVDLESGNQKLTLASGKRLRVLRRQGGISLTLDLDVADAIVIRP